MHRLKALLMGKWATILLLIVILRIYLHLCVAVVASQNREISTKFDPTAVQGHPRS